MPSTRSQSRRFRELEMYRGPVGISAVFMLFLGSFLTELLEILTMQIQFCAWSDELINEPGDFR